MALLSALTGAGRSCFLSGFSAIDSYLGRESLPFITVTTDAGLPDLARLFDLRFPGPEIADAAVHDEGLRLYFRCMDPDEPGVRPAAPPWPLLTFSQDMNTRRFHDPAGVYLLLREIRSGLFGPEKLGPPDPHAGKYRALMTASLILARYTCKCGKQAPLLKQIESLPSDGAPGNEEQAMLLLGILSSPCPAAGFELLKEAGFLREFWPLLADLDDVDHSKEFHPEGNVWKHTLEALSHRKQNSGGGYDLTLSLGILLHDAGKPLAAASEGRRFDGHAELGAKAARRFLESLDLDDELCTAVSWLVKNHMLPAALRKLPLIRTEEVMKAPLFPLLMELYRCDEASSFKGLDGYYENSAAYRRYLKNVKNPYRSDDGRLVKNGRQE